MPRDVLGTSVENMCGTYFCMFLYVFVSTVLNASIRNMAMAWLKTRIILKIKNYTKLSSSKIGDDSMLN